MTALPGLDTIRSFLTLAEELNFRRTAERLHLDQSALTRRIQKLEQDVGFALFERTTREVRLTQAGRRFYDESAELLHDYADAVAAARRVADGKTGMLRIGYMAFAATRLMPLAVAQFRRSHPFIDLRLRYIRTSGQKIALANDEIDLGFMIGPFEHEDYASISLSVEPLYLVARPGHPLLGEGRLVPARFAGHDIILGDMAEWEEYRLRLNDMFLTEGIRLNVVLEATNTLALIGLVAAGAGVTIYPESLIDFLGESVETRRIEGAGLLSRTILVWKLRNRSPQLHEFVEMARAAAA